MGTILSRLNQRLRIYPKKKTIQSYITIIFGHFYVIYNIYTLAGTCGITLMFVPFLSIS